MKKNKILAAGIAIGMVTTMGIQVFAAPAIEKISAYVNHQMSFEFDGVKKALPAGYDVLVYQDRSYVPAKFVAENLGATVDWNDQTKVISLHSAKGSETTSPSATATPSAAAKPEESKDPYSYQSLPQTKDGEDYRVSVLSYSDEGSNKGDRLYIKVVSDTNQALQVDQMKTKVIAGGETYTLTGKDAADFDTKWYNPIQKGQTQEGYLRLPKGLKNQKQFHVEITVNVSSNQENQADVFSFDVKL